MRCALLLCLWIGVAQAQTVECPRAYPWEDTRLHEVPYRHNGLGVVAKGRLNGGAMFGGEGRDLEQIGMPSKVKGGKNISYMFPADEMKWLLCTYGAGGDIQWWEQVSSRATECTVEERGKGREMTVRAVCR